MEELVALDLVDTFRHFHPDDKRGFSHFTNLFNGHGAESGSRFDYFFLDSELREFTVDSVIRSNVVDFQHCPITLFLNL